MTVLVTGGAGFIGTRLVEALLANGEQVRVLDLEAHEAALPGDLGADLVVGDMLDREAVGAALDGCQRVFHVAALFAMWQPDRGAYYRVNVDGTRSVLETALAMGVRRVVHTSSAVTIGEARDQPGHEETTHRGYFLSDYERSKCLGEQVAFDVCQHGLPLVVLNPTTVYGPGQTTHMTGALARFLNGRLPAVVDAKLNFAYIDDVVDGHLCALERGEVGRRYIMGGQNASLVEFLSLGAEIAGVSARPRAVPGSLVKTAARALDALSRVTRRRPLVSIGEAKTASHSFMFDTSKAREELGLEWTPLREGLERTVSWLLDEGLVSVN
jgi:dihydroflavonol-4-reductase